jgi:hypothetical protein
MGGNMQTIRYIKEISIVGQYELVVIGGGMTGTCAAIAASRKGLKTLLVERDGNLGGVGVKSGVCHLLGAFYYDEKTKGYIQNVKGLFDEIIRKLISKGNAIDPYTIDRNRNPHGFFSGLAHGVPFDNESMKVILENMCLEANVNILYFTKFTDAIIKNNKITQIIIDNKGGIQAVDCNMVADTSGDADVAYSSGCRVQLGREEDGLMAPASLIMHVEHVDKEVFLDYLSHNNTPRCRELILDLREKGIWDFPYEIFIAVQLVENDIFMINTVRQVGIDGTNPVSITNGMIDGRLQSKKLFDIMKKYIPGFKNARVRLTAPEIGIRETRRIIGNLVVKTDDIINGTVFHDSIAVSSYGWDLPNPKKPSDQPMHSVKMKSPFKQIPYRCMLPYPIENLIVAGRCISVERDVLGPLREMGPCFAMGQAAGVAAVLAKEQNDCFKDIDVSILQKFLEQDGCVTHIEIF